LRDERQYRSAGRRASVAELPSLSVISCRGQPALPGGCAWSGISHRGCFWRGRYPASSNRSLACSLPRARGPAPRGPWCKLAGRGL